MPHSHILHIFSSHYQPPVVWAKGKLEFYGNNDIYNNDI